MKRILIADDEQDIRSLLKTVLSAPEREFLEARDGPETLRLATESSPALIILDWMMPGIDGSEVVIRLRRVPDLSSVPIIMISARTVAEDAYLRSILNLHAYIPKPLDLAELRTSVASALSVLPDSA